MVTAWNKKAANMLPSSAPIEAARMKNGIIVVILVMLIVKRRAMQVIVTAKRIMNGNIGYIRTIPSTFVMKTILPSR